MTFDLIGMGEPMLEFSQLPPEPDGRRLYLEGFGGDTSNATIAAARQGARTAYITGLGTDFAGDSFVALWGREGVSTEGVVRKPAHLTGVYFIFHGPKGHQFLHHRQNSAAAAFTVDDLPKQMLADTRLFFTSGVSQGISATAADAVFGAIDIVRGAGGAVAYDTNYRPRLWPATRAAAVMEAAIRQTDIVFPGMEDALVMTGLTDPDRILDHYLRLGPRIAVLKMGDQGAYVATPESRTRIPVHTVQALDASGAGDTFCGSFLARYLEGDTPEHAARYANVAAALKCTGYGTVTPIPRREHVHRALQTAQS